MLPRLGNVAHVTHVTHVTHACLGLEAASGQRGAAPQAILALQEALEASAAAAGPGLGQCPWAGSGRVLVVSVSVVVDEDHPFLMNTILRHFCISRGVSTGELFRGAGALGLACWWWC